MKNETGIAILDLYDEADLKNCIASLPPGYENVMIVSDCAKRSFPEVETKRYSTPVQMSTLRNWAISQFRLRGLKHFFVLGSNQIIQDPEIFEKTVQLASTFGTWAMFGPSTDTVSIDDDESKLTLTVSNVLNSDFMYLFGGVVSNVGYFDERYFTTKELDVLDYIMRMREKGVYPPNNFHPTIAKGVSSSNSKMTKANMFEMGQKSDLLNYSFAFFYSKYKYIPGQNDPVAANNDTLLASLESIQKNYSKK